MLDPAGTRENMADQSPLTELTAQLPPEWKWAALFHAPEGFEQEWRAWLRAAAHAEEMSLLRWWGPRAEQAAALSPTAKAPSGGPWGPVGPDPECDGRSDG